MRISGAASFCSTEEDHARQNYHYSGNESSLILNDSASTGGPSTAVQGLASYRSHCSLVYAPSFERSRRPDVHGKARMVES
jgi:hypothetical protein